MDIIMVKVVVLAVVGLIILIALLGEFGPRSGGGRRPPGSRRRATGDRPPADLVAAHL